MWPLCFLCADGLSRAVRFETVERDRTGLQTRPHMESKLPHPKWEERAFRHEKRPLPRGRRSEQ